MKNIFIKKIKSLLKYQSEENLKNIFSLEFDITYFIKIL